MSRHPVLVAALVAVLFASTVRAQDLPPPWAQTVRLRSGEVVTGTLEAVHVGVDVTLRRPDGSVRVLRWVDLEAPVPPTSSDGVHVGVSVGPIDARPPSAPGTDDPLHEAAGRVALSVETPHQTLSLGAPMDGMTVSVRGRAEQVFRSLCETPCTLYVLPERAAIYTRSPDATASFVRTWNGAVPWSSARLQLWHPTDLAAEPTLTDPMAASVQAQIRHDLAEVTRIRDERERATAERGRLSQRATAMYRVRGSVGWGMFSGGVLQVIAGALVASLGGGLCAGRCDDTGFTVGGIAIAATGAVGSTVGIVMAQQALTGQISTALGRWMPGGMYPPGLHEEPTLPEWVPILTP